MNYYIDTEFLEGSKKRRVLGIPYKNTKPTIDLISIGIVSEDGREYYAISKDFNLKEAWNRYDVKTDWINGQGTQRKEHWIRNNVLKPIFDELLLKEQGKAYKALQLGMHIKVEGKYTYKNLKKLLNKYGKTNREIASEVERFVRAPEQVRPTGTEESINFYTYYGAYDWVVFCWLFGKMIDLPKGFPMFSKDLKVMLDDAVKTLIVNLPTSLKFDKKLKKELESCIDIKTAIDIVKMHKGYPTQDNAHNALDDAKWNLKLHKFINTL